MMYKIETIETAHPPSSIAFISVERAVPITDHVGARID